MARYRGKHRKQSSAGRKVARLVIAGAVVGTPIAMATANAQAATGGTVWDQVAQCEASGNWAANTGNSFYGGLQFTHSTWQAYGGGAYAPDAHQASRDQQIQIAQRVLAGQGANAWPVCSKKAGLTSASGAAASVSITVAADPKPAAPAPKAKKAEPAPKAAPAPTAPLTQPSSGTYTVQAGDTLSGIAGKLGQSGWDALYQKNQGVVGSDPNLILPGQVFNV
jgi:LysM repeat protein